MDDDIDEALNNPNMRWDKPHFYWNNTVFVPKIYSSALDLEIPEGFNVVQIPLDGKITSDLDWAKSIRLAEYYIFKGYKILWSLDLGLSNPLEKTLSDQTQFLTLSLSLKHFLEKIWNTYNAHTLGVLVYEGTLDFNKNLTLNDELEAKYQSWKEKLNVNEETVYDLKSLFSRDVSIEFLKLLLTGMPDELQFFIKATIDENNSLWTEMQLTNREKLDKIHLLLDNGRLPISSDIQARIALCLPMADKIVLEDADLMKALNFLMTKKSVFKIIPEVFFLTEWDGLDYLIVLSDKTTREGVRKFRGFCAAGGTIVTIGKSLSLANEIPYEEFIASVNL